MSTVVLRVADEATREYIELMDGDAKGLWWCAWLLSWAWMGAQIALDTEREDRRHAARERWD